MMRGGFSDVPWTLEELVTEGETVACRFTMRGTHDGTFFGLPPTGKHVVMQAMNGAGRGMGAVQLASQNPPPLRFAAGADALD